MTVRSVTTDLSQAYDGTNGEVTTSDATTNFSEPSGTGGTSGHTYADLKSFAVDTEFKLQGTGAIGGAWTTNNPERGGVLYNYNTATVPTDGAVLVWLWFIAPSTIEAYNVGGLWVATGSATSALNVFRVSGNNFNPAPKGGWYCFAVDPSETAERYEQVGTPTATINYIGGGVACLTAMSRGLTHLGVDAIRIGRCKLTVIGGTSTDPDADFTSTNTNLEAVGNGSFGIFELEGGSFYMQGMVQIGDNTSGTGECNFTDSNKTINIRNTPAVGANFNRIELQDGSTVTSNISLTGCTFSNLGVGDATAATASRGDWVNTDNVNLDLITCTFVDMGTFDFGTSTTCTGTSFNRCDVITQAGATLDGCIITETIATTAALITTSTTIGSLGSTTPNTFVGDGTTTPGHAVDMGTYATTGTVNWYNSLDNGVTNATEWEGSTQAATAGPQGDANAAVKVNVTSGNALKISVASGGSIPTVYNTGTGTVEITANEVTLTITVKDIDTGSVIEGAMVYVTNVGATATYINKVETNASGQVSHTTSLGSAQTLAGNVRAATPATKAYTKFYKSSPVAGTFSNLANTDLTIQLIPDE